MSKHVYINYPNPSFSIHGDPNCASIRIANKQDQRQFDVTGDTLEDVLSKFIRRDVSFDAKQSINDLWLNIKLSTNEQEVGVVHVIQAIVGKRYGPLRDAQVATHCG